MQSLNPRRLGPKIINPAISSKTFWSILERFATCRKIPVVPTLFINDDFISDLQVNAYYF